MTRKVCKTLSGLPRPDVSGFKSKSDPSLTVKTNLHYIYLSIYILESQKIGKQAGVEIIVRKSVCRASFVCFFWVLLLQ